MGSVSPILLFLEGLMLQWGFRSKAQVNKNAIYFVTFKSDKSEM
jgi:hypothetical protein